MDRDALKKYTDREQALVKHSLLKAYLERLIMITGQKAFERIAFVDAFAGPWQSSQEDLSDTSFGLAAKVMEECRLQLESQFSRSVRFRALFVEKDQTAYARLKAFTERNSTPEVELTAVNEDFGKSTERVARWIQHDEMTFVLIDPTGWKDVISPKVLAPILRIPSVEMLINVMWNFINLATGHESQKENLEDLIGSSVDTLLTVSAYRGEHFMRSYLEFMKVCARDQGSASRLRTTWFPVEFPDKNRVFYYLAYATHHVKGILAFLEVSEAGEKLQQQMKFALRQLEKEANTGIADLFGDEIELMEQSRSDSEQNAREKWLSLLPNAGSELRVTEYTAADMAEELGCTLSLIQSALRRLVSEGIVVNLNARRARPKNAVNFHDQETLRRVK